jgi:hypothetical protein
MTDDKIWTSVCEILTKVMTRLIHKLAGAVYLLKAIAQKLFLKSLGWHNTALKIGSKCSFTPYKLRFLADFCLVLHTSE